MSDEAFARRFYSDRAELTALGVPLQSQRDEFTGEELLYASLRALLLNGSSWTTTSSPRSRPLSTTSRVRLRGALASGPPEPRARTLRFASRRRRRPSAFASARPTTRPSLRAACRSSSRRSRSSERSASATGVHDAPDPASGRSTPTRFGSTTATGTSSVTTSSAAPNGPSGSHASVGTSGSPPGASATFGSPPTSTSRDTDPAAVADRRNGGDGAYLRLGRHRVVGRADALRCRDRRGRSVRDRVRERRPARRIPCARTAVPCPSSPMSSWRRSRTALAAGRVTHRARTRGGGTETGRSAPAAAREAARAGRPGTLRCPAGAPRTPSDRMR